MPIQSAQAGLAKVAMSYRLDEAKYAYESWAAYIEKQHRNEEYVPDTTPQAYINHLHYTYLNHVSLKQQGNAGYTANLMVDFQLYAQQELDLHLTLAE